MNERSFEVFDNLVALEGGDGSGKGTQTELLRQYASDVLGRNVMKMSFPRYGKASAIYSGEYLDGKYGGINDVNPNLASLTYAIDRFDASGELRDHLILPNSCGFLDRWVASNLAHQGAKIDDRDERYEFYQRTMNLEYGILKLPKPKTNIVLVVPTDLAQLNVDKKDSSTRSYTTKKRDIHEADPSHLEKAKRNFAELCELYPEEFVPVQCVDDDYKMRSIEAIQQEIRTLVF